MKIHTSHSLEETQKIAAEWLVSIIQDPILDKKEATVVGLSGHLGAGKTAFVKAVAKELGITGEVTSPTFVLMKIYSIEVRPSRPNLQGPTYKVSPWTRLIHIDAYRLEKREELQALDFENIVSDPGNLVMIEWPENVDLNEFEKNCHLKFEIRDGVYEIKID